MFYKTKTILKSYCRFDYILMKEEKHNLNKLKMYFFFL